MFKIAVLILLLLRQLACFANSAPTSNSTRIVGGANVPEGQFVPYQVSMQYYTQNQEYRHFCGGSIISPNRILTAAHCCKGFDARRMTILAGVRELNDSNGIRVQVESYEIHPKYEELVTCDIAILKLAESLSLDGARMTAINVRGNEEVGGGVPVTLTGWGLRLPVPFPFLPPELDTVNYPNTLQRMTYHTITNEQCRNSGMDQLTETEICARGRVLQGACSGDSGGPLVMSTDAGPKQVGIVSYGLMICGVFTRVPDVYTRVSKFDNWIQERI